ncbi:hypothetical protein A3B26_03835 [Candidatus Giovannonibacteria bacterium RIFCSPLOWO2_01_FULL_48_47]|nr:MAG: hypothetical protein A3B26_03835 [Candidatus Giovannonibacteria bacterium RIFCSPLOWO2_01_FULL_48_47]
MGLLVALLASVSVNFDKLTVLYSNRIFAYGAGSSSVKKIFPENFWAPASLSPESCLFFSRRNGKLGNRMSKY